MYLRALIFADVGCIYTTQDSVQWRDALNTGIFAFYKGEMSCVLKILLISFLKKENQPLEMNYMCLGSTCATEPRNFIIYGI